MTTVTPVLVGFGIGTVVVAVSRYRGADLYPVWSALALGLTCSAGGVFVLGVHQWRCLPDEERRSRREVGTVAGIVMLATVLNLVATVALDSRPGAWRGPVLVGAAFLGATPMVCVSYAVWRVSRDDRDSMAAGELTDWLLARRRSLRPLLASLGALVALSTLTMGAAVRMEGQLVKAHDMAPANAAPPEFVLIFGAMSSLIVAIVYVPTALGLRRQARLLAARLFTLTGTDEPPVLLERAEQRAKFEQIMGAETGLFGELQAGIVVLAPLLASAITIWLPH
ncbi:hypothetical protein [Streptomyces sp. NPDC002599]|uniref:hypothetical protein n=1 Tax=Streptomyces sp. NPDC002599 TaxID=3154421 RepID=UPI0033185DB4